MQAQGQEMRSFQAAGRGGLARSDAPWHVSSVLSSVVSKEADGGLTFPGWLQDKQGVGSKCHVVSSVLDVRVMSTRAWGWAGIWQRWIT